MVVVGADVHKRTHTFVAVDEVVVATSARHGEAVMSGVRLERDLLTAGQRWCGCRRSSWPRSGPRRALAVSPIRSMRWRW